MNFGNERGFLLRKDEENSGTPKPRAKRVTLLGTDIVGQQKYDKDNTSSKRSSKQEIFGGSRYSKALLVGISSADDSLVKTEIVELPNEALRFLEGTQHLFFRKCKTFPPELGTFNPKNKRGIWNSSGRVVYYTGEKKSYCCRCFFSGFIHEVVDYRGKHVIVSKGRQLIFGLNSFVEIFLEDGKLLGSMYQSCLSSTYIIKDSTGRIIYKIQAPCYAPCAPFVFWCCNEHFEICMDDGVTEIGMITKHWDADIAVQEFHTCVGIEMDRVEDVRVKALLLGCFFLIEFQYYRLGGNGPVYFCLMILIFGLIFLATDCAQFCPKWKDVLVYPFLKRL